MIKGKNHPILPPILHLIQARKGQHKTFLRRARNVLADKKKVEFMADRNSWLRSPEAACYVGLSESTLAKMRLRGDSPPYSKAGPRVVV